MPRVGALVVLFIQEFMPYTPGGRERQYLKIWEIHEMENIMKQKTTIGRRLQIFGCVCFRRTRPSVRVDEGCVAGEVLMWHCARGLRQKHCVGV